LREEDGCKLDHNDIGVGGDLTAYSVLLKVA
jgi:hypothetical protein